MLRLWKCLTRGRKPGRSSDFSIERIESRFLLSAVGPTLTINFDYQFDAEHFFDAAERRTALEAAATTILKRVTDTLDAIAPSGGNSWLANFPDPADESVFRQLTDLSIPANEILIFAGGQDLPPGVLGRGGPGGFGVSGSQEWLTTVSTRGETGAAATSPTDIGLWGGAITFDNQTNWHFGLTPQGLDSDESDFMSVALHELVHTFGFGSADAWETFVNPATRVFTGPVSVAEYDLGGTAVPLDPGLAHWAEGTTDERHEAAMDPSITSGIRKNLTLLDFAGLDDIGWEVIPPVLQALSFVPHGSGFDMEMTAGFNGTTINLYDTETGGLGAADVTVIGQTSGAVTGTLAMDNLAGTLSFIKTGGPLAPDQYTVTLRSGVNAFKDRNGALLDGDGNGAGGGDWVGSFTAAALPTRLLSLPDVARGPGQPINVPATAANIPIVIADGTGVTSVDVTFSYDPALFTPAAFSLAPGVAGGLSWTTSTGTVRFHATLSSSLGSGAREVIRIAGTVPAAAPYGATSVLRLDDPVVNGADAGVADSGAFVMAYFGDTTGNRSLSSLDAQRVLRVVTGLDSGFAAFPAVDPQLIGDITGTNGLSSLDATRILQEVVGLDRAEIPLIPPPPLLLAAPVSPSNEVSPQWWWLPSFSSSKRRIQWMEDE